jgi:CDP-diacylglycerol pyrophosphatase
VSRLRQGVKLCIAAISALTLAACVSEGPGVPPAPVHANGQALWRIIHDRCVPDMRMHSDPAPCTVVSLTEGEKYGFVVLKDRVGVAQHLLMPTAKITGIEDPAVLAPDAVNYFAKAWAEREVVEKRLGRPLERTQVSVAVNSLYGRTQDQLHLHMDCVDATVGTVLRTLDIPHDDRWSDRAVQLHGHRYWVRWLDDAGLAATNPFKLLAQSMPIGRPGLGVWTLALVGAEDARGAKGFYLLADRAEPRIGDPGSAEELQDHACGDVSLDSPSSVAGQVSDVARSRNRDRQGR